MRVVRCKNYHRPRDGRDAGRLADGPHRKSRCPSWADDGLLRQKLVDEALADPDGAQDSYGRPKVIWNAVGGTVFVGVSTNEQECAYNCYPSVPATGLNTELSRLAERTLDQFTIQS